MKKMALLLALAIFASLLFPCAFAATSGSCGQNITWRYDSNTRTLTLTGAGRMYDYTSKKAPWYDKINTIDTIVVSDEITYIGDYAFESVRARTITLPDTVEQIGNYAFYNEYDLMNIHMPASLEIIGSYAFYRCHNIQQLVLPDRVQTISDFAFYQWYTRQPLVLPASLRTIGSYAFYGCLNMPSVTFQEGLETIGYYAFCGCQGLQEITIPSTVTSISSQAFWNCTSLSRIDVAQSCTGCASDDGVLYNGDFTELYFYPRKRLNESYTVPASVTQLPGSAFQCSYLKSVTLSDGITVLPYGCFSSSVTHVDLPANLIEIASGALRGCTGLTELELPEGVTTIGDEAFINSGLTRLTVPASVTSIGADVFLGCPETLTIRAWPGSYICEYAAENNIAIEYLTPFDRADFVLPANLTVIEESALEGVSAEVVWIPEGVVRIGSRTFAGCAGLKHVYLPASVTDISPDAFDGAEGLCLYGAQGGAAEIYANAHEGITFVPLIP